jgi:hypothetical protein
MPDMISIVSLGFLAMLMTTYKMTETRAIKEIYISA